MHSSASDSPPTQAAWAWQWVAHKLRCMWCGGMGVCGQAFLQSADASPRPLDMPRSLAVSLALLLHVVKLACAQQQPGSPLLSSRSYATDGQPGAVLAPSTALQGLPHGELPASSPAACAQQCLQDDECSWVNYCPIIEVMGARATAAAAATAATAAGCLGA